ncbi:MAG: PP2C family protein-serine/threonine phosphatase [Planctomycetota bacterium]
MVLSTKRELAQAYDEERLTWLRKRFTVYAWIGIVLAGLSLIGSAVTLLFFLVEPADPLPDGPIPDEPMFRSTVFWVGEVLVALVVASVYLWSVFWVGRAKPGRADTIRMIYALFVGTHLLEMGHVLLLALWFDPSLATGAVLDQSLLSLFLGHVFAAIIIPWTVRESVQPLVPVVLVYAFIIALFTRDPIGHRVLDLIFLAMLGLPGMGICWLKQRWFQRRFQFRSYRDVYQYVSREVEQARALHESFFPSRIADGPLRLDYHYQPMSQLGGDYLHAHVCRDVDGNAKSLLCAVIDVTGHGLPATLTANHLHALLKRQTQSRRSPDPGELIADLNRYMHESFSGLSVFATALCMRIDLEEQRIVWASAGHPPGLLVSAGQCEPVLESTCCLLGVIEPELYDPSTRELSISDNVQIVAYTDGATELPLKGGGMLGIAGLVQRVANLSQDGDLTCGSIMRDFATLTTGERQDDILVVRLGILPELADTSPSALSSTAETTPLVTS